MTPKKQVLIICRSAAGQMYLGVLLKRIWYAPLLVGTAEEGVQLAQKTRFSLLLLDGDLPEIDLEKSLSLLRSDPLIKDIPLVLFMTTENSEAKSDLLTRGCAALLTKPLDLAIMYGVLGRLSGQERQAPRVAARFRVEIDEGIPARTLTCIDLSEGGMYLRTLNPPAEGTTLHVQFTLPRDTTDIKLEAEVVRTETLGAELEKEPGMGLRFLSMPEDAKLRLRHFVQWEMTADLEWEPTF